jgi:hypothetical protein
MLFLQFLGLQPIRHARSEETYQKVELDKYDGPFSRQSMVDKGDNAPHIANPFSIDAESLNLDLS